MIRGAWMTAVGAGVLMALVAGNLCAAPRAGFGATNVLDRYAVRESIAALPAVDGYQANFSGCCMNPDTGELVAVMRGSNTSEYAFQFYTPDGAQTRFIALEGFDDLEAVCVVDPASNLFAVVEERLSAITILAVGDTVTNLTKASGRTINMGLGDLQNAGIEGITYDAARRCFYAVKEYQPERIYRVTDDGSNVVTELFSSSLVSNRCADLSDLFYDAPSDHLILLSDLSHMMLECTLDGGVVAARATSLGQPEGVTLSTARDELFVVGEPRQFERFTAHWQSVIEGDARAITLSLSEPPGPTVTAAVTVVADDGAGMLLDYAPAGGTALFTNGLAANILATPRPDDTLNPARELRLSLANPVDAALGDDTVAVWRVVDPGGFACTWDTLPAPGAPFRMTIEARDTNGVRLMGFDGSAALGLHGEAPAPVSMINAPTTQSAALNQQSTRGLRFTLTNDITVSHLLFAFGTRAGLWTDDGTLLASVVGTLSNGLWQAVALTNPVLLSAGSSYRVAASRSMNLAQFSSASLALPATFSDGTILSGCLTNAANTFPAIATALTFAVDILYTGVSQASTTLTPAATGTFRGGTWSGWLMTSGMIQNAEIEADDANGHTGSSQPMDIIARPAVLLQVPSLTAEGDGNLVGAGRVSVAPPSSDLEVALVSENTNAVILPASVVVPAAATSAVFDVTVVDNTTLGDTRTAFLYATATNHTAGTNSITVWNDDRPPGLLLRISRRP